MLHNEPGDGTRDQVGVDLGNRVRLARPMVIFHGYPSIRPSVHVNQPH